MTTGLDRSENSSSRGGHGIQHGLYGSSAYLQEEVVKRVIFAKQRESPLPEELGIQAREIKGRDEPETREHFAMRAFSNLK